MRRLAWAFSLLAALTLTGLILRPETAWIRKTQWGQVFGVGRVDLEVPPARRIPHREDLSPANRAVHIRYLLSTWQTLSLQREDGRAGAGAPAPSRLPRAPQLLELAREAQRGERLDPGNAYFPALRAYALFGLRQDTEALVALHRAAQLPRYEDYTAEELRSLLQEQEKISGKHTALADLELSYLVEFPDMGAHYQLVQLAGLEAIRQEQAGHFAKGLAIRRDILLLGARLRSDATGIGPTLNTLHQSAARFPSHGALADDLKGSGADAEIAALNQAKQDHEALTRAHPVLASELNWTERASTLAGAWAWGAGSLVLACLMLVVGVVTKLLQHTGHYKTGKAALPGVRMGLWWALGVMPCGFFGAVTMEAIPPLSASCWFALLGALLAALWPLQESRSTRTFGHAAAAIGVVLGVFLVTVALLTGWLRVLAATRRVLGEQMWEGTWSAIPQAASLAPFALCLPLLVMLALAIVSRVRRVPITVGVVRFLPAVSVVLASVLLLGQAAFVQKAARLETALRQELRQKLPNQGALLRAKAHIIMRRKQ